MKKLIFLLICTATLGLVSCKKDVYVPQTLPNKTIITYIEANQWRSMDNGTRYSVTLNVPEIDNFTFEDDGILVYVSRGDNNTYEQLPFVFDAQAYAYLVSPRSLQIDIQTSGDTITVPKKPTTRTRVKIVLVTSSR